LGQPANSKDRATKSLVIRFGGFDPDQSDRTRLGQDISRQQQREQIMSAGEVLFVTAFIMAFGMFAIVLGWADHRTRHLNH
jgi:hypothetical protein